MVQITAPPGKTKETVQDDAGAALNDGLTYDDPNNAFNVDPGQDLEIDGNGKVGTVNGGIEEAAAAYSMVVG